MNCIIIEDEKPAKLVLVQFITDSPGLSLIGAYKTAMDAQSILSQRKVDLIFLDINLPVISGITMLKAMTNPPLVIVTTAYSEYALESFELDVVDYLLKPFSFERFVKATNKAFRLSEKTQPKEDKSDGSISSEQVIINVDKTLYPIRLVDLQYIASDKDYVVFHTKNQKYVFVDSLRKWERELSGNSFIRVHKSYIVNLSHINKVEGNVITIGSNEIPIGRNYRAAFLSVFIKAAR